MFREVTCLKAARSGYETKSAMFQIDLERNFIFPFSRYCTNRLRKAPTGSRIHPMEDFFVIQAGNLFVTFGSNTIPHPAPLESKRWHYEWNFEAPRFLHFNVTSQRKYKARRGVRQHKILK